MYPIRIFWTIPIRNIEKHVIQKAFARNRFYSFRSLKQYFPHIKSLQDFSDSEDYLAGLEITFQGDSAELYNLSNKVKLEALTGLLQQIEIEIRRQITEYVGTREFKPGNVDKVFYDKVLKLSGDSERAKGDEGFLADKEWYVFNANYGTSEEKAFVRMLDRQIDKLREIYDGIYLVRNERHFKIYNFTDGRAFEPDFVLFLQEKDGNLLTYQLFIEPKGKHLKAHENGARDY